MTAQSSTQQDHGVVDEHAGSPRSTVELLTFKVGGANLAVCHVKSLYLGTLALSRTSSWRPTFPPKNLRPCVKLRIQMFPLVWSYVEVSFWRPKPTVLVSEISEVDQQILQELAVAAETRMVSTRSQEPGLVVDFEQKPPKGTPGLTNTKRKSPSESHSETQGSRPHKRYKEATPDGQASFIRGNTKPLIPVVSPTKGRSLPNDGIEVRIANGPEHDASKQCPSTFEKNTPPESPSQQDDVHTSRYTSGDSIQRHAKVERALAKHSPGPLIQANGRAMLHSNNKPKHKRFGSQDPPEEPLLALENSGDPADTSKPSTNAQMENESEDEAPETILASTGLDQARSAANEAAKVAEACVGLNSQLVVSISDVQ